MDGTRKSEMITLTEILTRLTDIHSEFVGDPTDEECDEALAKGYANPCGCSICMLEADLSAAIINASTVPDDLFGEVEAHHAMTGE